MQRPLCELRDRHHGQDIWLIAAGKSLDYIDVSFFDGKVTLGINQAYSRMATDYLVVRDWPFFPDVYRGAAANHSTLIAAEHGFLGPFMRRPMHAPSGAPEIDYYTFACEYPPALGGLGLDCVGTDTMIGGMSTLHTALNVCAYLGAANIILCGADGGLLDDEKYFDGYRNGDSPNIGNLVSWLGDVEAQTIALRGRLKAVYGVTIASLNPFLNFGLEGHRYTHA